MSTAPDGHRLWAYVESAMEFVESEQVGSCSESDWAAIETAMDLGEAWQLAEAVLPEEWAVYLTPALIEPGYQAEARPRGVWLLVKGPLPSVVGHGDSPAAALRALVAKLNELPG